MSLILIGMALIALGGWFVGAIWAVEGGNRQRVLCGYFCGWTFMVVGSLLVLGI